MYKLYEESIWVSQFEVDDIAPFGIEDHLLPEYQGDGYIIYPYEEPTMIYVKGGPVRVRGTYKGKYTIITDEYQAYKRHAWGSGYIPENKEDTLWTNIFILDDLINVDAEGSSLLALQPDANCNGGSDNALGLVSGANIIKFQHHLPDEEMLKVVPNSSNFKISLYKFFYSLMIVI